MVHAYAAAEAGADFLGLVFAPSRRQVLKEKAQALVDTIHLLKKRPAIVGVFANSPILEVNDIANHCKLDWVQLSGDETAEYCQQIVKPIIKVIHVSTTRTSTEIISELEVWYQLPLKKGLLCLLDTSVQGAYGGTGQVFDWQLVKEVSARFPVMVAGGLTPENVGQLTRDASPWGVDVSTGVETNGKKDVSKITAFIQAVKAAERFQL
jgi:phosphoribosylanthranilate isomerase